MRRSLNYYRFSGLIIGEIFDSPLFYKICILIHVQVNLGWHVSFWRFAKLAIFTIPIAIEIDAKNQTLFNYKCVYGALNRHFCQTPVTSWCSLCRCSSVHCLLLSWYVVLVALLDFFVLVCAFAKKYKCATKRVGLSRCHCAFDLCLSCLLKYLYLSSAKIGLNSFSSCDSIALAISILPFNLSIRIVSFTSVSQIASNLL